MKQSNVLIQKSRRILVDYYQGKVDFLKSCADPDFLWCEPSLPSPLTTNRSFRQTPGRPEGGSDPLPCHIRLAASVFNPPVCEILFTYSLHQFKSGILRHSDKEIQMTWIQPRQAETALSWRLLMVHLSDQKRPTLQDTGTDPSGCRTCLVSQPGSSYTANCKSGKNKTCFPSKNTVKIHTHGGGIHILRPETVLWVESCQSHSLVHTCYEAVHATEAIRELALSCQAFLYRPHISYLINPDYITEISRCDICMADGAHIPVPERKYTRVRAELESLLNRNNPAF